MSLFRLAHYINQDFEIVYFSTPAFDRFALQFLLAFVNDFLTVLIFRSKQPHRQTFKLKIRYA